MQIILKINFLKVFKNFYFIVFVMIKNKLKIKFNNLIIIKFNILKEIKYNKFNIKNIFN